jgi:hypothetical protein
LRGFQGSLRVVSEWKTRRRRAEKVTDQQLQKVPSARTITRLMTTVLIPAQAAHHNEMMSPAVTE